MIVMDRKMVMSLLPNGMHRVDGISPMLYAALTLGRELHIDVFSTLPHALYARGMMKQASSTISKHSGSDECVDLCGERLVGALWDKTHDGAICCVRLMRHDVGVEHLIRVTIVGGKVDKHTLGIRAYICKLSEQVGVWLRIIR